MGLFAAICRLLDSTGGLLGGRAPGGAPMKAAALKGEGPYAKTGLRRGLGAWKKLEVRWASGTRIFGPQPVF